MKFNQLIKQNTDNILLIGIPLVITTLLIFVGYKFVVAGNPEASAEPPKPGALVEILQDTDAVVVRPKNPTQSQATYLIANLPQNKAQLSQLLTGLKTQELHSVYLVISTTVNPDSSLKLSYEDLSSAQNIERWTKKTVSTLHQNNYQVMLVLLLNASTTVTDSQTFLNNYLPFVTTWAKLATELGIPYFYPGLTLGHPLYSKLTPVQIATILQSTQATIRRNYGGKLGVGFCCSTTTPIQPNGYNYFELIPTPEFDLGAVRPVGDKWVMNLKHTELYYYDRENMKVEYLPAEK
jgi:hypothetical protein